LQGQFEEDKFPHVLEQLSKYRIFLAQVPNVEQVESAYREAAKRLVELRALADAVRARAGESELKLGASIIAASRAVSLTVAPVAALVVVGLGPDHEEAEGAWKNWTGSHEGKLSGKISMRVLESPGRLVFAGAQ
jgi:hypothetical protein